MKGNTAVLILGGNKGDRLALLNKAMEMVLSENELVSKSRIYETEAWGGVAKAPFLNQVVQIKTAFTPIQLLDFIQEIETNLGRERQEPWGDRSMDIDIIFYGNEKINTERLKIPHPFISERSFVLTPLAEILPNFIHPMQQKTVADLLSECGDESEVKQYVI